MGVWLDSNGCTLSTIPFIDTCINLKIFLFVDSHGVQLIKLNQTKIISDE